MFKYAVVIFAVIACTAANPFFGGPLAYADPAAVVAGLSGVVTASSSQFVGRNYNGIATGLVAYSNPMAYSAPLVTAYAPAYFNPLAYSAPWTYAATPWAYANAAYASSLVGIKQNYNAAVAAGSFAAAAAGPVATPLAAPVAHVAAVANIKDTAAPVLL